MKLPNGYGSVYRLHGNRRKPWAVRVTVSRDPWKYKYLGYYETQDAALTALALYNKDPYDLDAAQATFADIYDQWSAQHFPTVSTATVGAYRAAYRTCTPLYDLRFTDIRLNHLQGLVDRCGKNYPALLNIKLLFGQLYRFAMRNEICQKDYSQFVDIKKYHDKNPDKTPHRPFTPDEVRDLWSRSEDPQVRLVLMLIYTGVRVMELLDLKKDDVDLENQFFSVTASKTAAGIRTVPIPDRILPFFRDWMDQSTCGYVISAPDGYHMSYQRCKKLWAVPGHRPHDTRHTFISLMAEAGIDERITKRIVGHKGHGVTENIYTHFDPQILLDAVNQLK